MSENKMQLILTFIVGFVVGYSARETPGIVASQYTTQGIHTKLSTNRTNQSEYREEAAVKKSSTRGYVRPSVIYGHIHIAKTAGTTVNGELALNYERVCGNKGYSHDFYQVNERSKLPNFSIKNRKIQGSIRGKVPMEVMKEEGWEDCDYISLESSWTAWKKVVTADVPYELHVPCREPVDYLMSVYNHENKYYECNGNSTKLNFESLFLNRFSSNLEHDPSFSVKCYDFQKFSKYIEYMGEKLQQKRITTKYVHRSTNKPRNKENECIWKDLDAYRRVQDYLINNYDFFKFCNRCMGSKNELPLSDD